jgi:hypothetical protein
VVSLLNSERHKSKTPGGALHDCCFDWLKLAVIALPFRFRGHRLNGVLMLGDPAILDPKQIIKRSRLA